MRKHLLRILTLVFVVCFGACLFAACGDGEGENPDEQPATYTLTYNANGGTGADVTESHAEGDKVILKAATTFTNSGYTFKAWNDGTKDYDAGAEFTMPASNVTLKAQWTKNQDTPPAPTTYKVTVTGDHVTATFDAQGPYAEGTTVKFTLAIDNGFELVSVKNGDADVQKGTDNKYFVVVGKADIAITVTTKSMTPTPVAKHSVTVGGEHVTATFDEEGPYEEGTTVKFSLMVASGYEIVSVKNGDDDVEKGTDDKYFVVVGTTDITITVTTQEKKEKGELADTALTESVVNGGREDAQTTDQNNKNKFMLWWVKDTQWNCGDVVTLTPEDLTSAMDEDGKLSFQYKGGNRNFSVQLFYFNDKLVHAEYIVTLTIQSNVTLSIIVNGKPVELKAGAVTPVEVLFKNCTTVAQSTPDGETYSLDIQFPGTTASTDASNPNAGVELGTNQTVDIEVSDVKWYCVKGTEEETMPFEEVEVTATGAKVQADENGAYFVLSGTTEATNQRNVVGTLKRIYLDLQEVNNGWRPYTFAEEERTITFADGAWTLKVDISVLPVREIGFTVHVGGSDKNLSLTKEQAVPDGTCEFGLFKYTLTNYNGDADASDSEAKNWGAVAVKVESKYAVTSADLEAADSAVYFVLSGTYEEDCDTTALKAALEKEYFDVQGNADNTLSDGKAANWERIIGATPVVTIDTTAKTWTVKYDISACGDKAYSVHFGLYYPDHRDGGYKFGNSPENGMGIALTAEQATDGKNVTYGGRTFTLVNKPGETAADKYWGKLGLTVSFNNGTITYTGASLTKGEDGKIYLSFNGTYAEYTEAEVKTFPWYADLQQNDNVNHKGWDTTVLKNGVLTVDDAQKTWSVKYDITDVAAGCYTTHFNYKGFSADFLKPHKDAVVAEEADGKTYTLVVYTSEAGEKYWGCYGVEIANGFTVSFDKNGAGAGDDPEIKLGGTEGGVYNVTLPENSFTAPDNKYFRGWEIDGVVYFPGEKVEVEPGSTVTLKAIWAEHAVKTVEENFTVGTWNPNTIPHGYVLSVDHPIIFTGEYETIATSGDDIWDGYVVEIMRPGESSYFVRPDGVALLDPWTMPLAGSTTTGVPEAAAYKTAKTSNPTKITITLADSTITVKTEVGSDVTVLCTITGATLSSYVINIATDDATAKNTKIEYYRMYETPVVSAEDPLKLGLEGNTIGYTANNPLWVSTLKKGEKVVLKGTMTSAANATTAGNYMAMLAYLYSGYAPVAAIRSDNYIVDEAKMLAAEEMTKEGNCTIENATKHDAASGIKDDTAFWASMRAIIANCTAEITFDYTDASKIVITIVYTGDDNKFTQTYTFTAADGKTLKDEYNIGLGGDHNYTVLTSLVRSSVKAAD